ncbi:FAD-dependent oxidoreductase [Pseudalkalibacillus sp. A8]|uniref:FAD-dependent oxidoreductase n=1 Tax=Pseudalkalibacillus sp. A8 TaxID=3382641 RepID=UPI0038B59246
MHIKYDLIVIGGGPAGINAAIAAGRSGMKTLIIERYGFLGGMSTSALVYPWMTFHSSDGTQVIKGIAQEIVDRLIAAGGSPGHLRDSIGFVYSVTPYRPEVYQVIAMDMLYEAGVDILLHSFVDGVQTEGSSITSISVTGKSGRKTIEADLFVDCTGDGDIAYIAGVPMQTGRTSDNLTQPITMKFRMRGCDLEEVKQYMFEHKEEFYHNTKMEELEQGTLPLTVVQGFYSLWKEADLPINRDHVLFFTGPAEDEVLINCTRIQRLDGTNQEDLTVAEYEGRKQALMVAEFLKKSIPGFKQSEVSNIATQVGVRETRRIKGEYILTQEDVIHARKFEDVIAKSGYPIDIHNPTKKNVQLTAISGDGIFDIPYRCLYSREIGNLLVAGRCISTTHEAFSTTRLTPSAMATGQAAGIAASIAHENQCAVQDVSIKRLQLRLVKQLVVL